GDLLRFGVVFGIGLIVQDGKFFARITYLKFLLDDMTKASTLFNKEHGRANICSCHQSRKENSCLHPIPVVS
ncbi:hypothetical protein CSA56_13950, partial [candidate division KSB3 bacterium]